MEYDKKINENVAIMEKLLKERYIFINPTLSDVIKKLYILIV